jgi:hypothetical protein
MHSAIENIGGFMASVAYFFTNPVYQAPGQQAWNIAWGDRDNCWTFSVRPYQSNNTTELIKVAGNTGNGIEFVSTDLVVNVISAPGIVGGFIRMTATRVGP